MASKGSLVFEMDQNSAYEHVINSLGTAGAEVTSQAPPNWIEFNAQISELGFKYGYEGKATISPLPGGKSNVGIEVHASNNTIIIIVVSVFVLFVITWFLGNIFWWLIVIAVSV